MGTVIGMTNTRITIDQRRNNDLGGREYAAQFIGRVATATLPTGTVVAGRITEIDAIKGAKLVTTDGRWAFVGWTLRAN